MSTVLSEISLKKTIKKLEERLKNKKIFNVHSPDKGPN